VVQKLLDAGAIVFGKTNLHELAYGITNNNAAFGPARNPYDPSRIPGASSGGVGVAVAARMAPGGIGSDTGGSVRIPAALCGIVGFRPTTGRWPQAGVVPISHTRDTAGPMTRSVADCELIDAVVTGSRSGAAVSLKGLRLGVPRAHFWAPLDAEVARLMEGMLAALKEAGAVLVEADIADVGRLDNEAGFPIALYETVADLDAYLAGHGSPMRYAELVAQCASPDVAGLLQSLHGAGAIPAAAYRHALDVQRPQLQAAYRDHFARHDLAALVLPTTPLAAAPIGDDETVALNGERVPTFPTFIRNTSPGSVAGIPGISVPAALTKAGLPLGLELDGPAGSDAQLLAIARAVEALLPKMPAPKG
jgi:indoleacetamide hydrolase